MTETIITSHKKTRNRKVGDIVIINSFIPGIDLDIGIPVELLEEKSRQEFLDFWKTKEPIVFEFAITTFGFPPNDYHFFLAKALD